MNRDKLRAHIAETNRSSKEAVAERAEAEEDLGIEILERDLEHGPNTYSELMALIQGKLDEKPE